MRPSSHRPEKFASTLHQHLAEILLSELDNPELKQITISQVSVSPDLRHATVLVSSLQENIDGLLAELEHAAGFIKRLLGQRMRMRYMPDLAWRRDAGFVMEQKLARLGKP